MFANGNGQNIVGAHDMAWLGDFCAVETHVSGFNQFGGRGALLDDPGEPQPPVETLCQLFLPAI